MPRTILRSLLLIPVLLNASVSLAAAQQALPNIVLIVSDYMGYHDTEPYGATDIRTPSLNRIAGEGVRFTDFYAAAPVCGPARAALYTGRYPARIGFEVNIRSAADGLSAAIPTLPQLLRRAGYKTALHGKWHLGYRPDATPNAHGFDHFVGHHQWTIGYYNHLTENGEPGLFENDESIDREGYLTDLLSDETVAFIGRNRAAPFFVTLAYNAALPPYQPPGLPESQWNDGWDVNEASRDDYVKMVERMDEGIGKVLAAIDDNGLSDNTLVIYLYDHGGRHLVDSSPFFHGFANLWEGGIRVPLLMRFPGRIATGTVFTQPGIAMDVTATILGAAGLGEQAAGLDGIDLMPYLGGRQRAPERQFFWRAELYDFGAQRAVRDGRWKYMQHDSTQFLFDIDADPGERINLFSKYPGIVNRLRADLDRWEAGH
jgi:arylsulfatase A-like enzyme